jgi:hypothetical protein
MKEQPARTESARRRWPWVLGGVAVFLLLLAAAGFLYSLHWQHKADALLASYRAKGEPVTWEEVLAVRDTLPADQNSALIFQEALARMPEGGSLAGHALDSLLGADEPGSRPSSRTLKLVQGDLAREAPALAVIRRGARLPDGVYPLPSDDPYHPPYLQPLREAVQLCGRQAVIRAAAADGSGAADALLDARRMCASLGPCWTMAEVATRTACEDVTTTAMAAVLELCQLPPTSLSRLREEVADEDLELTTRHAWMGERADAYQFFYRSPMKYLLMYGHSWGGTRAQVHLLSYSVLPFQRNRDALAYYAMLDPFVGAADLPAEEAVARLGEPLREGYVSMWFHGPPYLWPEYYLQDLNGSLRRWVEGKAGLRVADTALAAEQWRAMHGRWPDALSELVPELLKAVPRGPWGEGALRYARTESGVVVYSLGSDGKDDGGRTNEELEAAGANATAYVQNYTGSPRMSLTPVYEGGDLAFRLLNPELRGARQMTFADEVRRAGLRAEDLEALGVTQDELRAAGLDPQHLHGGESR